MISELVDKNMYSLLFWWLHMLESVGIHILTHIVEKWWFISVLKQRNCFTKIILVILLKNIYYFKLTHNHKNLVNIFCILKSIIIVEIWWLKSSFKMYHLIFYLNINEISCFMWISWPNRLRKQFQRHSLRGIACDKHMINFMAKLK